MDLKVVSCVQPVIVAYFLNKWICFVCLLLLDGEERMF